MLIHPIRLSYNKFITPYNSEKKPDILTRAGPAGSSITLVTTSTYIFISKI